MRAFALDRSWATALVIAVVAAACGGGRSPAAKRDDAAAVGDAGPAPAIPVVVGAMGLDSLAAFGWRSGPGAAAFARALIAEKSGDLVGVEREATAALAADPGHLEAAWLVAVARARLGRTDDVVAPLAIAAAGDWPKWGERSLELNALAAFRATPAGRGWVEAAEPYRAALAATLARSVVVVGARPGTSGGVGRELYAVDVDHDRWVRLTRSGGVVAGGLPAPEAPLIAYVTASTGRHGAVPTVRVGTVDRSTGRVGREVTLADVKSLTLGWRVKAGTLSLEVRVTGARGPARSFAVDWRHGKLTTLAKPAPIRGERLELSAGGVAVRRLPIASVTADWDERGTASALRLDRSGKVIAAPGGALIDGETVALSADRARVAFVTALEPPCDAAAARELFAVEVTSGRVQALGRGALAAPTWIDDDRLAVVDGDAVDVVAVATGKTVATIRGGAGVSTLAVGPRRRCDDEPPLFADPDPGDPGDPDDWTEPVDAGASPDAPPPIDGAATDDAR